MTRPSLWLLPALMLSGCADIPVGFDSPEPAARMEAAAVAAREGDTASVEPLIGLLDSDDPATRLVAIRALERLTGETHGYDHAASEGEREAAVLRWVEWSRAGSVSEVTGG